MLVQNCVTRYHTHNNNYSSLDVLHDRHYFNHEWAIRFPYGVVNRVVSRYILSIFIWSSLNITYIGKIPIMKIIPRRKFILYFKKNVWNLFRVRPAVLSSRFASFFLLNERYSYVDMSSSIGVHSILTLLKSYSNAISPCTFIMGILHSACPHKFVFLYSQFQLSHVLNFSLKTFTQSSSVIWVFDHSNRLSRRKALR